MTKLNHLTTPSHAADLDAAAPPDGAAPADASDAPVIVIEARPGWKAVNIGELWQFRELLYFLTWRDVKVRYKQSLLGAAWAIIQPVMYMIVFTIVFGNMADVPDNGIPYPLFSFSGLLLWTFFSGAIVAAGNSVVNSSGLVTKVYFPRLAIPFASVGAGVVDLAIGFVVLLGLASYYMWFPPAGYLPVTLGWQILLVLPIAAIGMLAALAVGTILAALNVAYRDFKHAIPFLVQIWMFATPAIYMGELRETPTPEAQQQAAEQVEQFGEGVVPDSLQEVLALNPMTGLIESFRAAVLNHPIPWGELAYSAAVILVAFVLGCFYFHRVEDSFADII